MVVGAGDSKFRSRTLGLLVGVFVLASLLGYLVVRDTVNKSVEQQALAIAEVVARQATAAVCRRAGSCARTRAASAP